MSDGEVKYLSPEDMGRILSVDPGWIRKQGKKHGLPLKKVGHYVRCEESAFYDWLETLPDAA